MKNFAKRNLPILIVSAVTVIVFLIIIAAGQKEKDTQVTLQSVDENELIAAHTYVIGNPKAELTIVEFSDPTCESCMGYHYILLNFMEQNQAMVKLAYRHFPNEENENAKLIAMAAQVAGEQNKFWDYLGTLFRNISQEEFTKELLVNYASILKMDTAQFSRDLDSSNFTYIIEEDLRDGKKVGVTNTPTIFINGSKIEVDSPDKLKSILESELEKIQPKKSTSAQKNNTIPVKDFQSQESTSSHLRQDLIEESQKTLEIKYTAKGWSPETAAGFVGQKVVWTNTTDKTIHIEQLDKKLTEFAEPKEIAPGGKLEFVLYSEKIWRYQEKDTRDWGAIYINKLN
jgi:protein-disulfide isomerase